MALHASLRALLDNVLDAVIVIGRDGDVRGWNHISEEVFGWSSKEAIGRSLAELIVPPEHQAGHAAGMARYNASGVARVLDRRLRMTARTKAEVIIPIELTITLVKTPTEVMFVGFLRDLTEQERAEEQARQLELESRLMFQLSALAAESPSLDEAFEAALDAVCQLTRWPVGHAFLVTDDGEGLQSRSWSRGAQELAPDFVKFTEELRLSIGEGLPGRILKECSAIWIERTSDDENFPRRGLGFDAAFGFPVMSKGKCIAVFEFFSRDVCPPDNHILQLVQSLGAQVGRVFERRRDDERREVVIGEMAHRLKNLISVVQGIAYQTFGRSEASGQAQALEVFVARLHAIASAQGTLFAEELRPNPLHVVIENSIRGCGVDYMRVGLTGPEILLTPSANLMMSLAVHELSTNSFKYGALSTPGGNVSLTWEFADEDRTRFNLKWEEIGGPAVKEPSRNGFGHKILRRAIESETGGRPEFKFLPDGFVYELRNAYCCGVRVGSSSVSHPDVIARP